MKAALIVLVCAAFLFSWKLFKQTAHIGVENISQIDKASNVEISIDRKLVFNGIVEDVPKKFRTRLSKGKHYIVVRADNGELVQTHQFTVKGKTRINVKYKAEYQIDPVTRKPFADGALSKQIMLSVGDWDYSAMSNKQ